MELLIHQKQLILTLDNRILESQKELVENHQLGSTLHYYKIDTGFLILILKKMQFFQIYHNLLGTRMEYTCQFKFSHYHSNPVSENLMDELEVSETHS